ncbi:hypothetical protein CGH02_19620 [Vibrio parahaemolyticus]|nr:hypothetical protein CGI40_16860 [Vibrio parahaemolyticus]TOJ41963.1 hypothetical protein CGI39_17160 [Vibrio parahaemolyticus]TOJ69820.1 hypothetical protein CGI36_10160 [Vibrio parahaemolyticus]TOQ10548.1 hypothetical protein CGH02_19620 [Vibrio parahaemolyticus]
MSKIYYLFTVIGYLLTKLKFINTRVRHCPHLFTFSVNNFVKNSISTPIFNQKHYSLTHQ